MSQIKYNNKTINKLEHNASEVKKMYYDGDIAYGVDGGSTPTPTGSTCYEVISAPITSYTSTTYNSVFTFADTKWYMLNNLSQYEEYGIYETGTSLSDFTYYPNKLVVIGETEYQYQSNGWVEVGEYIDIQTTYEVTDDSTALQGKELSTTFKIPYADVEAIGGYFGFGINATNGDRLEINNFDYRYNGSTTYQGTVTNDGEYYYYSLPSEAPSSIVIDNIGYWNPDPIHLIFGSKQISVQYAEKEMPTAKVYNTVASLQAVGCPTVGVGQYGVVGDDVYQFEESEEWVNKAKKFVAKYNDGNANAIVCNASNELSSVDTQPSYFSKNAMTDAYIGNCVTSIGVGAFYGCSGLTSVTIPDSVTSIGGNAFYNCKGLTSITIPDGVTIIGNSAFYYCSVLTSVTIPDSVTTIGSEAFRYCSGLTSVTVDATTPPTLGTNVFTNTYNCPIYVPCESVNAYKSAWSIYATRIQGIPPCGEPPTPSFNGKWLATYTGGTTSSAECNTSSVITSGEITKTDLVSLEIGSCVTNIGSSAFTNTTTLSSVTILDGLTSISNRLFHGCSGLTSVTIPDSVGSIGTGAFWNCTSLTSVTIPNSVRSISQAAFFGCGLTSITIPNSITSIGQSVFGACTSLTSVTIPNSVTSIGESAFVGCYSLSSITIPNSVTSIGESAFSSCSGLTSITIPDGVTIIGQSTFNSCYNLTSVTIGNGVTIIQKYAFRNCRRLTSITINATTPPRLVYADAFEGTNNCPIYVPSASVDAYKTATNWSTYAYRIQAIPQ